MTRRFASILVGTVLVSVALTVLAFVANRGLTFDPFAELTLCNDSSQSIAEAVFTQGDLTIVSRNLQPGERRPLRFERHPHVLDDRYTLTVRFADGHILPDCGGSIAIGEKHNKIIRTDGSQTAYVRSGTL